MDERGAVIGRHAVVSGSEPAAAGSIMRHLTVTGFLVYAGRVLLHWHQRNQLWLPMGGHIEPNEDPLQAVLREVEEESGVAAEVIATAPPLGFTNLRQLPPPATIFIAPVRNCGAARRAGWTGSVEHIDLVYYCRPVAGLANLRTDDPSMRWLDAAGLTANLPAAPAPGLPPATLPDDVRELALDALRAADQAS